MFVVEVYAAVRQFVFNDGKSRREAARVFGLSRETVSKMCRFSMPPGYVRHIQSFEYHQQPPLGVVLCH
jgi:DNA-binding transcriptional regulator LsrR (DeoR family)